MKKISNFLLQTIFAAFCFTLIGIGSARAVCDEDAIKKDITKTINTTASQLRTSLEDYNRTTKTFMSSCGEITDEFRGKPLSFDLRTLQQALSFDKSKYAYLTDVSQYEDTAINWGKVPANTENCENLRVKAWSELDRYTSLYTKAIVVFGIAARDTELPISCICPEGSQEAQCTAYTSTAIASQQTSDNCETFATYLSSLSSCPLCPLFQVVLNTDAKIADIAWRALSKALRSVVMVFFMIFLALETLKIVSNVPGSSIGSYLKTIFVLGFKATLTYFLLDNSAYIYGYFISPVIQAGLDMGTSLISVSSSQASVCLANNANVDFVTTPGNVLDAQLLDNIMRTVRCYGHTATIMPAIGRGLICHGWEGLLPDFSMWFSGILFYLFGLMIWLVISFYLIDCTVQLGMVCGLVPFLIACWPFKATEKYSIKGVQMIMNTFFNYVMLGIVLLMGVEIVDFATGQKSGTMDVMMKALNDNNIEKLSEIAELDGVEILILVICCLFAFKLIGNTNALADKFSKGAGMNIASKLGGLAQSAAVASVATGGQLGGKLLGNVIQDTGVPDALNKGGENLKEFALDSAAKFGQKVGLGKYQTGGKGTTTPHSYKDSKGGDSSVDTDSEASPDKNTGKTPRADNLNKPNSDQSAENEKATVTEPGNTTQTEAETAEESRENPPAENQTQQDDKGGQYE